MDYDQIYKKIDQGAKIILAGVTHKQVACAKFFTEEFMKNLYKRNVKYLFTELDPERIINGKAKQKYFDDWNNLNKEPAFINNIPDLAPIWRAARKAGMKIICVDRKLKAFKSRDAQGNFALSRDKLMCDELIKQLKQGLKAIYAVGYQHIKTTKETIRVPMIADANFSSVLHYDEPEPLGYRLISKLGPDKVLSFKV